ncbi:MAG: hypothetical protein ACJ768_02685 [Gaiellaceae bacterium]
MAGTVQAGRTKLSVAVMYHPSRAASACEVLAHCAALSPRLVPDPDPTGPPSPLRTAKQAWSACPDDATHHLVLQDDLVLADNFAAHLEAVVLQRPAHGIALYVNRNSPRNSYLFRRSAAVGARFAPVSSFEYTPTLGLVLPAEQAWRLAAYLQTIPDERRDDDEAVTVFCRDRSIPVVAAVPSLIEHGELPSLAGNESHGPRHGVAFLGHVGLDAGYWADHPAEAGMAPWRGIPFTLEVRDSRCLIRFARSGAGEPVDNLFGWYWHDWCELLGVRGDEILDAWGAHMEDAVGGGAADIVRRGAIPSATALEFWAAGFLLGFDLLLSARVNAWSAADPRVLRRSVDSWVAGGLSAHDERFADGAVRAGLAEVCLAGFAVGCDGRTVARRAKAVR